MSVWIVSVVSMMLALYGALASEKLTQAEQARLSVLKHGQAHLFEEAQRFHQERGTWPASVSELATADGFFALKAYLPHPSGGAWKAPTSPWTVHRSSAFSLAGLQDQRFAVVARTHPSYNETTYLGAANNQCEGGSPVAFSTAVTWCPASSDAMAVAVTTTEWAGQREQLVLRQHAALADKLLRYRRATGTLPAAATATNVSSFAVASDASSVVGTGTATCKGTFSWAGMPLECGDVFNVFGSPIRYRRISLTQFELSSASQVPAAGGTARTLSVTYTFS